VFTNQGLPEPGLDGGGIIKEFLNRVIKTAFDPLYGLFGETPLREIVPSPKETMSAETGKEYEFIGMIVGKAIYENILIEAKFSGPFLNLIIGRSNSLEDLKSLDPELYRSLISLKHANGNT
jgi:ubiquitin-protein ligase E3 C